jgi:RimJ/RimL family protein N-acetyltransferase
MGEEHLESTLGWLSDPLLRRQIDSLGEPSADEHARYWRTRWSDPGREDYAILDGDGQHVGNCGLSGIDVRRLKAELWIYLGERRGRGIARAAAGRLLERAFCELRLNRVYVRVLLNNPRAERFFRGLGFVDEGRLRDDTRQDGRFVDALWLSMLAREFRPDGAVS